MSGITGKIWGETRAIEVNPFVEFHRACIRAGKRCSRHRHDTKVNAFFVESGTIRVRVWQPNGIEDVTELCAGEYTAVDAGVDHRFEGVEDAVVYEVYWPAMRAPDIIRKDVGGDL